MTEQISNIIDNLLHNRDIRVALDNRQQGEEIIAQLLRYPYLDFDLEIYTNCSGQLLLWGSCII